MVVLGSVDLKGRKPITKEKVIFMVRASLKTQKTLWDRGQGVEAP